MGVSKHAEDFFFFFFFYIYDTFLDIILATYMMIRVS